MVYWGNSKSKRNKTIPNKTKPNKTKSRNETKPAKRNETDLNNTKNKLGLHTQVKVHSLK